MATIVCLAMDRFMLNLTMDEIERLGDDTVAGLQNLLNPPAPAVEKPEPKPVSKPVSKPKKKVSSEPKKKVSSEK
tara:strand:+ start:38 stop:262 length:225 start_codon:yes stop_codon:yes gene_type:complete